MNSPTNCSHSSQLPTRGCFSADDLKAALLKPADAISTATYHSDPDNWPPSELAAALVNEWSRASIDTVETEPGESPKRSWRITGRLDLTHCRIDRPVIIRDAKFVNEVDLRYSEFTQVVVFDRCTFIGSFNSGDSGHTRTHFHKDLIFNHSIFRKDVSFNRVYIEGNASFDHCQFEKYFPARTSPSAPDEPGDTRYEADFSGVEIERTLSFHNATLDRSISFNELRCRTAEFHGTRFLGDKKDVDFTAAQFAANLEFVDLAVWKAYDAPKAPEKHEEEALSETNERPKEKARSNKEERPVVKGRFNLRGVKCERCAIFCGIEFGGYVDCRNADFGWYLDCRGACFQDGADFTRSRCEGAGLFEDSCFESCADLTGRPGIGIDFRYACFKSLDFSRALFGTGIDLGQTHIDEKLKLNEAWFGGEVLLYGAELGTLVLLSSGYKINSYPLGTVNAASPNGEERDCYRKLASMREEAAKAINDKIHPKKDQEEPIEPNETEDSNKCVSVAQLLKNDSQLLDLVSSYFLPFHLKPVKETLHKSRLRMRYLRRRVEEPRPRGVELRGCTFQRIDAGPVPILNEVLVSLFVRSQKVDYFSRDPYLQIEKHYKNVGDEEHAHSAHIRGHLAMGINADNPRGTIKWTWWQKRRNEFSSAISGWGLEMWRIALVCASIIIAGTLYFALVENVLQQQTEPQQVGNIAALGWGQMRISLQDSGSEALRSCGWDGGCWLRRLGYSFSTFVPLASLKFGGDWGPVKGWPEFWRNLIVLSGWLFVPLWLGIVAGIGKSD